MPDPSAPQPVDPGDPVAAVPQRMPGWVWRGILLFWFGYLATIFGRGLVHDLSGLLILLLISLFLSLAIEPGVNRLATRGWRRGTATSVILIGVLLVFLLFIGAVGTLVGNQIAELLGNSEKYVNRTVNFINDNFGTEIDPKEVIDDINDPDGRIQKFIASQGDRALQLSVAALGVLLQGLSVLLFTFYLVADGPRLRRAICSRLPPMRQQAVLDGWELAITKTGGYLYSRALLAGLSAFFHWVVFQAVGTQAPVALALWVGFVSQFLPVVGTYLAGVLPVLVTFIDSPQKALIVLIMIVVYQQVENYFFAPRITARTMELHAAVAFGSALAGGAVLGAVGAILALPAAAMVQALVSQIGPRYEVVESHLTSTLTPAEHKRRRRLAKLRRRTEQTADRPEPHEPT